MTKEQRPVGEALRVGAAAIPFLASLLLLGVAVQTGQALPFAIGWPALQVFGYVVAVRKARGDMGHPLVTTQIVLHWLVLALAAAVVLGAT